MSAKIVRNLAYEVEQEGNTVSILCSVDLFNEADGTTTNQETTIEICADADQQKFKDLYEDCKEQAKTWSIQLTKEYD
jgi:hypothetical protein